MNSKLHPNSPRTILVIIGLIFIFAVYPLTVVWPTAWSWYQGRSEYYEMIVAIYATLGVFLILASRQPEQHLSLISFTIWSSIVHGTVMGVQAIGDSTFSGHLLGDVPSLFIVAAILGWMFPKALQMQFINNEE